jgi:threonine/homoserine/homoserine lactone efflux protein
MVPTALAVLALAGGAFFVFLGRRPPELRGRKTRLRRAGAHALRWTYLVSGLLLMVRGTLGLFLS